MGETTCTLPGATVAPMVWLSPPTDSPMGSGPTDQLALKDAVGPDDTNIGLKVRTDCRLCTTERSPLQETSVACPFMPLAGDHAARQRYIRAIRHRAKRVLKASKRPVRRGYSKRATTGSRKAARTSSSKTPAQASTFNAGLHRDRKLDRQT